MKLIPTISGKGGTGKSITSLNIAYELAKRGEKVGIADIDITGPSIPKFAGIDFHKLDTKPEGVVPYVKNGIEIYSTSFLMPNEDQAVALKGAMRYSMTQQILDKVIWSCKYLVVDLPPGAGDETTYILKKRAKEIRGVVIVTTPSDKATAQVRKSLSLCQNLSIPILGIVENQSGFTCPTCKTSYNLYPHNNGFSPVEKMSKDFNTKVIAKVPFLLDAEKNPLVVGQYLTELIKKI